MFDFWQLRGNGCRMLPMSSKNPEEMARWNSCGMSICSNCWFARNRFFLTSQYYIIVVNNAQQHLEPCHQHALNGFDLPEEDIHGHSACTKCQQCHTVSTYIALINKLPSAAKCCQKTGACWSKGLWLRQIQFASEDLQDPNHQRWLAGKSLVSKWRFLAGTIIYKWEGWVALLSHIDGQAVNRKLTTLHRKPRSVSWKLKQ